MKKPLAKDDLLFHTVHGLCRITAVTPSVPSKEVSYFLFPVSSNNAKVRFIVPFSSMENSGFSKLISVKDAHKILEYLKTGSEEVAGSGPTWTLAASVWSESYCLEPVKDNRKRQMLERSVRGLAGELAHVLKVTLTEVAEKIKKNLGKPSKINPLVLTALANICDDEL